jgi:hypothetical protein
MNSAESREKIGRFSRMLSATSRYSKYNWANVK